MKGLVSITLIAMLGTSPLFAQTLPFDLKDVSIATNPDFCGISATYNSLFGLYTECGGVAVGDYDNDGKLDVYLPNNRQFPKKLYHNLGGGHFQDVAASLGVTDSAFAAATGMFIDYDNDGDRDLISIAHAGWAGQTYSPNLVRVFRNRGAANNYTFANLTSQCGLVLDSTTSKQTTKGMCGGCTAGDYDNDGFLDFFVTYWQGTNNTDLWRLWKSQPNPVAGTPTDPNWSPRIFVDDTKNAGLDLDTNPGEPWQPTLVDIDRDGWLDLHVSVDFGMDYLFMNDGTGKFLPDNSTAVGLNGTPPTPGNDMGAAFGDMDNDGDLDIHTTRKPYDDHLYRNDSTPAGLVFNDVAVATGTFNSAWGWGDIFFDVDNDGDLDHSTVSGFKLPTSTPYWSTLHINLFPQKLSDNITVAFNDVSTLVPEFSGTNDPQGFVNRGLVALDFDNDGDLDAIQTRQGQAHGVYKNTLSNNNRWVQFDLTRIDGSLNVENSRLWIRSPGLTQYREILTGTSFLTQEPSRQHFGLAKAKIGDLKWAVVRWPTGQYQIVANAHINEINAVKQVSLDDAGDLDGDRHLTPLDLSLLKTAVYQPAQYEQFFGDLPGRVTGDIDGDGKLTRKDIRLWSLLPPH